MIKNKWERVATLFKVSMYVIGLVILLNQSLSGRIPLVVLFSCVLLALDLTRQFYLNRKGNCFFLERMSVVASLLLILAIEYASGEGYGSAFLYMAVFIIDMHFMYAIGINILLGVTGFLGLGAVNLILHADMPVAVNIMTYLNNNGIAMLFTFIMGYFVKEQVTERKKLERANLEVESAYRKLIENTSATQQLMIEKERLRMAREIHDTLAHTLTAALVQMEATRKLIPVDQARALKEIEKAQGITLEGLNDVKASIRALRPLKLENRPFFEAIRSMANEFQSGAGPIIRINHPPQESVALPSAVEIALFRIIQESITNSIRHGRAKNITITLSLAADTLHMTISDDGAGCGFIKKGYGLQGILERADALSGVVTFESTPGKGFVISMSFHLTGGNDHADQADDSR